MKQLFVIYDSDCALCKLVARRITSQPQFVPVELIPSHAPSLCDRFPGLNVASTAGEVVAISDTGDVYRGDDAWLICLWALKHYRTWAISLARPKYRPLLHRVVGFIGEHRYTISQLIRLSKFDVPLASDLKPCCASAPYCDDAQSCTRAQHTPLVAESTAEPPTAPPTHPTGQRLH